ncbi:MAG: hypothetical protein WAN50_00225 [Minisyncoccia bacterium]
MNQNAANDAGIISSQSFAEKVEPIDPSTAYGRDAIATKLQQAMDEQVVRQYSEPFRSHLGMSLIGAECDRMLWYHFRWFRGEAFSARELRLFNDGHNTEPLIRAELRAIGVEFLDTVDVDGKQITVSLLQGHYGGSCDGVFIAPRFGLYEPTLLEVKTSKTGAEFTNLVKKKMASVKPRHYLQNSCYGKALGIKYCLYIAKNKNDSTYYVELVELDWQQADNMERRALNVIQSQTPPERLSEQPSFYVCKMCKLAGICHGNDVPVPNCRNCANAHPTNNEQWYCDQFQQTIPKDYLPKGCPHHRPLPR